MNVMNTEEKEENFHIDLSFSKEQEQVSKILKTETPTNLNDSKEIHKDQDDPIEFTNEIATSKPEELQNPDDQHNIQQSEIEKPQISYMKKRRSHKDLPFCIQLLKSIKKYPILYKVSHTHNVKVSKFDIQDIWSQISRECGTTISQCLKKWTIIKASHKRYLRNSNSTTKPYYLSKHMKFLMPHYGKKYNNRNKFKHIPEDDDDDTTNETFDSNDKHNFINETDTKTGDETSTSNDSSNNYDNTLPTLNSINHIESPTPFDNSKKKLLENINHKHTKNTITPTFHGAAGATDNSDLKFLKSLLPDLAILDRSRKVNFRITVLNLVRELVNSMSATNSILLELENNPDDS